MFSHRHIHHKYKLFSDIHFILVEAPLELKFGFGIDNR